METPERLFAPIDIEALFQRRRSERVDLEGPVTGLSRAEQPPVSARLRNLSSCGFMAECPVPIQIGSYVSLEIPGVGPVEAQVRWQMGARVGAMFSEPISLSGCAWTATTGR